MGKIAFVLDAGHMGGYNTGAMYPYSEGTYMWYLQEDFTKFLSEYENVDVIQTKEKLEDRPEVFKRGQVAAKLIGYDYTVFLSFHTNAYNGRAHGTSIFRSLFLPDSKELGKMIGEGIVNLLNPVTGVTYLRGVETRKSSQGDYDYYGVIRGSMSERNNPLYSPVKYSYMIEHAFHDNPDECKFLVVRENITKIAEVEVSIIAGYLGLKKKIQTPVEEEKPTESTDIPDVGYNEERYKQFKAGDLVMVTADTYFNSTKKVPQRVKDQLWYVYKTPTNNRVVINENQAHTESIMSPVDANDLELVNVESAEKPDAELVEEQPVENVSETVPEIADTVKETQKKTETPAAVDDCFIVKLLKSIFGVK